MTGNRAVEGRQEGGGGRVTPFGDTMRRIRKEKGILLIDMANVASVTSGFLSQVETGKKPIPERLVSAIVAGLDLSAAQESELREMAALSAREYKIQLSSGAPALDRRVAHALQTGFAKMSPDAKAKMLKLLEEG